MRIAIARMLIRKPRIILLDEASAALDARTEQAVNDAIDAYCKSQPQGVTRIAITHRLRTVVNCDRIIVMKNGAVFESGTHEV